MSKYLLILSAIAMLALCSCKGRHADDTPTGETVEVEFPAMEQAPSADANAAKAMKLTDSAVYIETAAHIDSTTYSN